MSLTDEAITKIRDMIVSGALKPGAKLPREADLAENLGLSRNSLREAVKALSLIHVLDVRQGDGTYVTSLEPAVLMRAMEYVVDFHQDDTVLQFLEVRRILEPAATAMAATQMPEDQIAVLRAQLQSIAEAPSIEELVASDLEFHRLIAHGCGNSVIASLLDGLSGPTQRARVWRGLTESGAVERTMSEHLAIVEAIESRQPHVAHAWSTVHISGIETWLRTTLGAGKSDPAAPSDASTVAKSRTDASVSAR